MLEPEEGAEHLEVVTFSSAGGRRRKDNPSHAEHQFMSFFDRRVPNVSHVTSISITLSHSPCSLCAQEAQRNLADFVREQRGETSLKQRKDEGNLTLELAYDSIHTGSNPTRPSDLAALRKAGWDVRGNQDFGRGDEIVTVEQVADAVDPGPNYRARTAKAERRAAEKAEKAERRAAEKAAKAQAKAEAKAAKEQAKAEAKAERERRRKVPA
jgi:hypothetical protein